MKVENIEQANKLCDELSGLEHEIKSLNTLISDIKSGEDITLNIFKRNHVLITVDGADILKSLIKVEEIKIIDAAILKQKIEEL